jgi:hypothetical protein
MKIWEIVENLNAGPGGVTVGNAGSEAIMLHPPAPKRRMKQIPQVGYGIQVGNEVIPTPRYNSANDMGQVNKVEGG